MELQGRQVSHMSDFARLTTPGASPFVLSAAQNLRVETLLDSELGSEHLLSPKMAKARRVKQVGERLKSCQI